MVVSAKEKRTIRVFKFEHGNGKRRKACLEGGCERLVLRRSRRDSAKIGWLLSSLVFKC